MKKSKKTQQAPEPAKNGMLAEVGESVKENLKVTPSNVTEALIQDAKLAVNYEIRRGMRSFINKLFTK
jgi:hypothetical protein